MNSSITAVVLAGGEGKRFKPFIGDKTLFPFLGHPLIYHVLSMLAKGGISKALVVTNKENDAVIRNLSITGLEIRTSVQIEPKGMADALLSVRREIPEHDVLVTNGVDLVDPSLFHDIIVKSSQFSAVLSGVKRQRYMPAGYLVFEGERVIGVIEKPGEGREPSPYVKLVFDYVKNTAEFMSIVENSVSDADDIYEKALTSYIKEHSVGFVPYVNYWHKLKYPHFALDLMDIFLEKITPFKSESAVISGHAIIEGAVYIDDGARIFEGAVIKGPAYIGRNVVVGSHTLVRESIIEEGAVVGFGSEVARSYIGPRCMLHHNFVGDSVLESDINPSYGTTTANWRIDGHEILLPYESGKVNSGRKKLGALIGAHCFFGINCSIMPGTVIGHHVTVYPAQIVKGYVDAGTTVTFQK